MENNETLTTETNEQNAVVQAVYVVVALTAFAGAMYGAGQLAGSIYFDVKERREAKKIAKLELIK